MKKKLSLLLLFIVTAVFTLTGCGSKEEEDVLRVGLEAGYAPFNWTQLDDSNGAVKIEGSSEYAGGYDIQIAKKIAGKIDAIIAGMSPTAERKETIDFTDVYYKSDLVMLVKKGGAYENAQTLKDFSGAKITGQLNTFHYTVIDQIPNVNKQAAMSDFPAMRVALESGVIDGYVTERPEALSAQMANDNFKMVEFKEGFVTSEEDSAIAVGLKKDSELKDKINEALKGISEEERLQIMDEAIKNQPAAQ